MQLQVVEGCGEASTAARKVPGVWRRRPCSRAGLPCCTVRGTGHGGCLLPGTAAGVCRRGCSQGCPGLSLRAGSLQPRGCVLGQGLCRLPGSALSLPGELPTALWGEAVWGRRDPRQGRVLLLWRGCCVGQGCSQLHITPRTWAEAVLQEAHEGRGYLEGKVLSEVCAFIVLLWFWGIVMQLSGLDSTRTLLQHYPDRAVGISGTLNSFFKHLFAYRKLSHLISVFLTCSLDLQTQRCPWAGSCCQEGFAGQS